MADPELIIVPIVLGLPTIIILVRMVLGHRERQSARQALSPSAVSSIDARLERLEQAMDAIAVEMERLGEGQRFTTKLLSERAPADR